MPKNTDIRLFGVNWSTEQGGPSPDNNMRTELYFMGCNKAALGNPCEGCYNPDLWVTRPSAIARSPEEMATHILKYAPNKFITIVGGEPTDQMDGLIELCKLSKANGFHILIFTWKELKTQIKEFTEKSQWTEMLKTIDILIDGQYLASEKIYSEDAGDGFHNMIGSGNQIIWDLKEWNDKGNTGVINGCAASDLVGIYVLPNGDLCYITKANISDHTADAKQKGAA